MVDLRTGSPLCRGPGFKLSVGSVDELIRMCRSKVQVLCALVNLLWQTKWKRAAGGVKCVTLGRVWRRRSVKCHSFPNKAFRVCEPGAAVSAEAAAVSTRGWFRSLEITDVAVLDVFIQRSSFSHSDWVTQAAGGFVSFCLVLFGFFLIENSKTSVFSSNGATFTSFTASKQEECSPPDTASARFTLS